MLSKTILQKFTANTRQVMENALQIAHKMKAEEIKAEHLLFGIWQEKGSLGTSILKLHNFQGKNTPKLQVPKEKNKNSRKISPVLPISEPVRKILKKAAVMANQYSHKYIGTEHLLYSIIDSKSEEVDHLVQSNNIDKKHLKKTLLDIFKSANIFPDPISVFNNQNNSGQPESKRLERSILSYFCVNLTEMARENKIEPVIGRAEQISRLIHILNRKTKNNPILIGEPGVGKTAIVHGLALKIAKGDIPGNLQGRQLLSLDLGLLMSGTVLRGDLESRIKDIVEEIKSIGNIIIFIDEIHNIVGTGSAMGSMDAANILKPILSQGDIQCIGATTLDEYRRYIERDRALERRFQPLIIKEISSEDAIKIIHGLKTTYEEYHNLKISPSAIKSAVRLSQQYILQRYLPDKAIDVLDETAARIRSEHQHPTALSKQIESLKNKLKNTASGKEDLIAAENYNRATVLKEREEKIRQELSFLETKLDQEAKTPAKEITEEDIRKTIANMTGIPLGQLRINEIKTIKRLEKILSAKIIGQPEAIKAVTGFIKRNRAGLTNPHRPLGSFLFLGPTGVGKTELAKTLAKQLFGSKESFIRLDMSEFMERHNVSRLIGAPPGYIGYEEGGKLTEQVKRFPYSLVLLDEIEKAHPDVFNILLQILEDGILTDARGTEVSFRNALIVLTSNIGTSEFSQAASRLGFTANESLDKKKEVEQEYEMIKNKALGDLKNYMKPELINRIDRILVFKPLGIKEIEKIISLHLMLLEKRLQEHNVTLTIDPKAKNILAKNSFNLSEGGRLVRRQLQKQIEDPLADIILDQKEKGLILKKVQIKAKNGSLVIEPKNN